MYKNNTVKANLLLTMSFYDWFTIGDLLNHGYSYKINTRLHEISTDHRCIESEWIKSQTGNMIKKYRLNKKFEIRVTINEVKNCEIISVHKKNIVKQFFNL